MTKVIYIHNNYEPEHFPSRPDTEDRFFTYGFGSNLARNFKKFHSNYDVEMWRLDAYCDSYYEKKVQGVLFRIFPAIKINKIGEFSRKFISELKKETKMNRPILFVSHTHIWLLYQIAWFFKDSPIVTSHHGDWSPYFKIKKRRGPAIIKDLVDILIEKIVLKNVDFFLVCDYNQIPYIKKSAPDSQFEIHSTGLNVDGIKPYEKNKARKILGWDPGKKYILYIGRLYRYKQPKELIDIWKEIRKEMPALELVIIGSTNNDEYYDYAVKSGAIVLGRILNKDLNLYYSASDAYVLISLRDDYFGGIGIAPLESLACNTPVVSYSMRNYIGSNIEELGEIPATLEDYKKAILKVLHDSNQYRNMRKSVEEHYSYRKVSEKTELVFKKLIKTYKLTSK